MAKKSTQEKKRVNPFDVVVVLLVICLLVSLGYRVYVGIADETNRNVSEYVIEFESKDCKSILSYLSSGTAVYMASNGELLGYLYASEDSLSMYSFNQVCGDSQCSAELLPCRSDQGLHFRQRCRNRVRLPFLHSSR